MITWNIYIRGKEKNKKNKETDLVICICLYAIHVRWREQQIKMGEHQASGTPLHTLQVYFLEFFHSYIVYLLFVYQ